MRSVNLAAASTIVGDGRDRPLQLDSSQASLELFGRIFCILLEGNFMEKFHALSPQRLFFDLAPRLGPLEGYLYTGEKVISNTARSAGK